MRKVVPLLAFSALLFGAVNVASAQDINQCRAPYTITDNPKNRHAKNTGAAWVDLKSKTFHLKPGVEAFSRVPEKTSEYAQSSPIETVTPLANGGTQFTYKRPEDAALVIGTLTPNSDRSWDLALSVQKPNFKTATGRCSTGTG